MAVVPEKTQDRAEDGGEEDRQLTCLRYGGQEQVACPGDGGGSAHSFGGDVAQDDEDEYGDACAAGGEAIHAIGEVDRVARGGEVEDCDEDERPVG